LNTDLDHLLALSEDELLVEVGKSIPYGDVMGVAPGRTVFVARASRWWHENKGNIARHICTNADVCGFYAEHNDDNRALAGLLIDILGTATVTGPVPVGTLSVLLVKKGLVWVCGKNWPETAWASPS
jgi:hypothetical protein